MSTLHLNLKAEYFEQIKSGEKVFEYRLNTHHWRSRLHKGRHQFSEILIKSGYPKTTDTHRIIKRPWRGYEMQTIQHPHFGAAPVEVFAIRVN
jgi:hypothetical protein